MTGTTVGTSSTRSSRLRAERLLRTTRPNGNRPSRSDPLPSFLVIGAMKAGTTSLFHYLEAHPQVFMARLKELDFFIDDDEGNWRRGLDWYRHQFRQAPAGTAIGEASPSYSKYPQFDGVPERIASCLPDVKLIYVVRDPIERIRSHYAHRTLVGAESDPIEIAVARDPSYLDCSRYALQISRYLEWFPRERLLVITSEDLRWRREETVRSVYRFIGVDESIIPATLNEEFFQTSERESYPAFIWWTRRSLKHLIPERHRWRVRRTINQALTFSPWLKNGSMPDPAPRASGGRSKAPGPSRRPVVAQPAVVSEGLRARLRDELRADVAELRRYMPDGFDGWGIDT